MACLDIFILLAAAYVIAYWFGNKNKCNHDWRAHHDFHHPIFCVKCGHIGTGYSKPSARCPLATNDELSLLDWQHENYIYH